MNRNRWLLFLASLILLAAVSYVDYITGDETLFFVFYFIPVALCGWYLTQGAVLTMATLSGVSWFLVDTLSGHRYSHEGVRYWNSFICFLAFATIGIVIQRLKRSSDREAQARRDLEKAYLELQRSTEEIRKVQGQLQVVCAWTKRIHVDDKWLSLDEFLKQKLGVNVSHGISPEAMEEVKRQIEGKDGLSKQQ